MAELALALRAQGLLARVDALSHCPDWHRGILLSQLGRRVASFLAFLEWLPLIFLPLMLAQQYGEDEAIPTTVFSYFARQRQRREQKLGKTVVESSIQIGFPYFGLTLVSAGYPADGHNEQLRYLIMLLILLAAGLYFAHRSQQRRVLPWLTVLLLVAGMTTVSSRALVQLFHWVKNYEPFRMQAEDPREEQLTRIGKLGQLKLDRRMQWRLQNPSGQLPPPLAALHFLQLLPPGQMAGPRF